MSRNIVLAFNILIVLGLITFSLIVYSDLPDKIPTHIDINGKADSFTDKSLIMWMAIPLLATFLLIVFTMICKFIDLKPKWVNVPHKHLYLDLSDGMRQSINQYLKTFMLITGFMVNVIMFEVQLMLYQAAIVINNQSDTLNVYLLLFFSLVFVVYVIVYLFRFSSMIKIAWEMENKPKN